MPSPVCPDPPSARSRIRTRRGNSQTRRLPSVWPKIRQNSPRSNRSSRKTNGLAKFSWRLPGIRDVVADVDVVVSQAERNPAVNKRGRRSQGRSKSVSEWLWTCCAAHHHSLMFLVKKDYQASAKKIVAVSVRPLTRWLQSEAYDGDGYGYAEVARRTLTWPEETTGCSRSTQPRQARRQRAWASAKLKPSTNLRTLPRSALDSADQFAIGDRDER